MTEKHDSPNGFPPAHQERLEQGREAGPPFFKKDSPSSSSSSKNTLIVGVGTLISRLLGFVRDAGIAWLLGGSGAADALTAALRIPYMARRLFGEGTLSLSLTAACTRERLRGGSGCGLALAVTRKLALWTGFLALACMAGAGNHHAGYRAGFGGAPGSVWRGRYAVPYLCSVYLERHDGGGCMAALHSRQRFLLPSLTPSLFNLCVIGFALLAAFNPSLQPGVLVACGVLCGGILQWLAQIPAIRILQREEGKGEKPADARTVSEVFRRLPAGIVGAAMPQLAFLGASALASLLPEGHMASLFYAERLLEFPLGVLGAAVGMAAAPRLAELAASEGLSRSSRSYEIPSLSLPQKPEQADPPPPLSASRTARNDTKATPGASLQKPWEGEGMEFEEGEPFFKRGEPPHGSLSPSPSSLPTAPSHAFSDEIQRAALLSLGLNLPAAAGLAAISLPLVAVVLGHGAFDAEAVSATALALSAYAPGLPAYALSRPLLAACHALESGAPAQGRRRCSGRRPCRRLRLHPAFRGMGAAARRLLGALVQCGPALDRTLPQGFPAASAPLPRRTACWNGPDLRERLWRCPLGRARLEHRAAGPCHTSRGSRVRRLPAHRRPEFVPPLEKAIVHLEHFLFTLPYFKGH